MTGSFPIAAPDRVDNRGGWCMERGPRFPRKTSLPCAVAMAAALLPAACKDGTGPSETRVQVIAGAGNAQYGLAGATLEEPLQVLVVDPRTNQPAKNVQIEWRVTEGAGAAVAPSTSTTNTDGIAETQLRLGSQPGIVRVEASTRAMTGQPAAFEARVVLTPEIESIAPAPVTAGQDVTITGRNFSTTPDQNTVSFGGLPGTVRGASATSLTVTVPACAPSRTLAVRVALGAVASAPINLAVLAAPAAPLQLSRGQDRLFSNPADLACQRLPATPSSVYLLIAQNAAQTSGLPMAFELRGIIDAATVAAPVAQAPAVFASSSASDWELALRARETTFLRGTEDFLLRSQSSAFAVDPNVGDRQQFNVLDPSNNTVRITAEVKAISGRAIMYQDVDAPANGFTAADFTLFGTMFDDPIYATTTRVFGEPSDVDGNGKIIILFSPRVNALTPRSDESFIAGYFYGCDLVLPARCAATNRAEIFYSMVPDPDARFSGRRTRATVLATVPGILAHEFQHMINFARKNESLDDLWLSEALAHTAEELVGDVFEARGDMANATEFKRPNYIRAQRYLSNTANVSIVAKAPPGTLEARGGGWLLLKYLTGHFGGDDLLGRLTRSTRTGIDNVAAETGQNWGQLFSDFSLALWTDGAPELQGVTLPPRLTFIDYDLRSQMRRFLGQSVGGSPVPLSQSFQDFLLSGSLPSVSQRYVLLQAGANPRAMGASFTGQHSGPFNALGAMPQLTLLRVQ